VIRYLTPVAVGLELELVDEAVLVKTLASVLVVVTGDGVLVGLGVVAVPGTH
jgi:hypothetical protein